MAYNSNLGLAALPGGSSLGVEQGERSVIRDCHISGCGLECSPYCYPRTPELSPIGFLQSFFSSTGLAVSSVYRALYVFGSLLLFVCIGLETILTRSVQT